MLDSNSLDVINPFWCFSGVEVGEHWYWTIGSLEVHGQVFIVSWIVIATLLSLAVFGTRKVQRSPQGWQNFMEFVLEFLYFVKKKGFAKKAIFYWNENRKVSTLYNLEPTNFNISKNNELVFFFNLNN